VALSKSFSAPWGVSLKVMSALGSIILLAIVAAGFAFFAGQRQVWILTMQIMPALILLGALPFMILGYQLTDGQLSIKRLGWSSRLSLQGLESATADPTATKGSLRTFGNGGLFCFAGRFWSKKLGHYRAFVTDPANAVVLKFADRTVVVTPDRPRKMAEYLSNQVESRS
jgi:hypothetical protein